MNARRVLATILLGIGVAFVTGPPAVSLSKASQERVSAIQIAKLLEACKFKLYRRTDKIPSTSLTESGLLASGAKLSSMMIDPGVDPESGHTMIDLAKPLYQLIFAGSCDKSLFVYFKARDPQGAGYIVLVRTEGAREVPIAGFTSAKAQTVKQLIQQLNNGDYQPLNLDDPLANPFKKIE